MLAGRGVTNLTSGMRVGVMVGDGGSNGSWVGSKVDSASVLADRLAIVLWRASIVA